MYRGIYRSVFRSVVRTPDGGDFPIPNRTRVYQANALASVSTGALTGLDSQDFTATFDLYVISHDASVRPVVGLTSAFTVPAQTAWQVVIQADDLLALSIRDADGAGFFE